MPETPTYAISFSSTLPTKWSIRIECADLQRSFQTPWLYLEDEITRFADSGIFSCAVQKNENKLIFTADCQIPDELPEQLIIRWFDSGYEVKTVVVKADK